MAEGISEATDNQLNSSANDQSSDLHEFREMVDVALNLEVSSQSNSDNMSVDEQSLNQALLSLEPCDENRQTNGINTNTAVAVAELPTDITDSLNVAAKQLSLLYESVVSTTTTDQGEEVIDDEDDNYNQGENEINSSFVQPFSHQTTENKKEKGPSTIPKPTTINNHKPQRKRHIMISYNHSCRETCLKIYNSLIGRNYKVWMDLADMGDDILVSMARAVENSYIVLLCINKQYYESDYCRLEAEYAQENRIKFIPCLMEKSFRAESWLGIIKGSNMHIDFSTSDEFDESFDKLIQEITRIEDKLSLQPRRTPAPGPMVNPMKLVALSSTPTTTTSRLTSETNSRRFDAIIREYKRSIKKKRHQLNQLKRNELSDLIVKLRQELFTETSQVLTEGERSDDEDDKQQQTTNDQFLQQLLTRSLDQNDVLLRLVDRLTTPQPVEQSHTPNLDLDGIIKVILAIMLLYTLNILCQKE